MGEPFFNQSIVFVFPDSGDVAFEFENDTMQTDLSFVDGTSIFNLILNSEN